MVGASQLKAFLNRSPISCVKAKLSDRSHCIVVQQRARGLYSLQHHGRSMHAGASMMGTRKIVTLMKYSESAAGDLLPRRCKHGS